MPGVVLLSLEGRRTRGPRPRSGGASGAGGSQAWERPKGKGRSGHWEEGARVGKSLSSPHVVERRALTRMGPDDYRNRDNHPRPFAPLFSDVYAVWKSEQTIFPHIEHRSFFSIRPHDTNPTLTIKTSETLFCQPNFAILKTSVTTFICRN